MCYLAFSRRALPSTAAGHVGRAWLVGPGLEANLPGNLISQEVLPASCT